MKNFLRSIACLLSFVILMLCGCQIEKHSNSSSISDSVNDTTVDSESLDSTQTDSSGDNNTDIDVDIDNRQLDYAFKSLMTEKMPTVSINTSSGDNGFATRYNLDSKLRGEISYTDCTVTTGNCEDKYVLDQVSAQVKVRGNYTLNYSKKPLRIKFAKKQTMFGLNNEQKFKSWVLLADVKDSSLNFNATAFFLGKTILGSDKYYCTDYLPVQVYLNGRYWGVYLLAEQQQVNSGRFDINQPEEGYQGTDIGYLFEYDGYAYQENVDNGGDYTFWLNYMGVKLKNLNGDMVSPSVYGYTIKSDTYCNDQREFLNNYVENVFRIAYEAVYNDIGYVFNVNYSTIQKPSWYDITPLEAIERVIDVDSLVDTYILQEICCDYDINWSSFYITLDMSVDGNKKLTFQGPWDYDSAFGGKTIKNGQGVFAGNSANPWLILFVNCDWFQQKLQTKWEEILKYNLLERAIEQIDFAQNSYGMLYEQNHTYWNTYGDSTGEFGYPINTYTTTKQSTDRLKEWLKSRFDYLTNLWCG